MKERYIRNNQPHIQPVGGTFSVTLLAHDAVPVAKVKEIRRQRDESLSKFVVSGSADEGVQRAECHQRYFEALEQLLDDRANQCHLFRDKRVAEIIMEYIRKLDRQYFYLEALCVMSNHIHVLMDLSVQVPSDWDGASELSAYVPLSDVVGRIKGGISYQFHKLVGDRRPLWGKGYYDRCIRSKEHFHSEQNYIVNNPVKAGLVSNWKDYPYTYLPPQGY